MVALEELNAWCNPGVRPRESIHSQASSLRRWACSSDIASNSAPSPIIAMPKWQRSTWLLALGAPRVQRIGHVKSPRMSLLLDIDNVTSEAEEPFPRSPCSRLRRWNSHCSRRHRRTRLLVSLGPVFRMAYRSRPMIKSQQRQGKVHHVVTPTEDERRG